jgi:MFS family permease
MIPGGWYIDRFGTKVALLTVGFGSALFMALTGAVGFWCHDAGTVVLGLLIVRGLMGIVSAPLHPSCARTVGHWVAPAARARCNGLVNGSALVGIAITPIGFGTLIANFDWPVAFFIAGAWTAAWAIVWASYARERPNPQKPEATSATLDFTPLADDRPDKPAYVENSIPLLRSQSLMLLTASYGMVNYIQYLFFYWMTYYFQTVLKLPDTTSRVYAAIPPLAMAVGMPLGGWLSDQIECKLGTRVGRRVVPMAGMFAGAVLLGAGVFAREPAWIVTWFALALGAVGASEGPFWQTAVDLGGRRGGTSGAIFNTGGNAGGLLAPIVTPWVGERFGWPWAMGLGALICLVAVVLWIAIDATPRKADPEIT